MPDQRHSRSRRASATSEDVPSPAPLHAVVVESDTDAATEYELRPRNQPLDTVAEQSGATTEVPDSEPTGDELGPNAVIPVEYRSSPSTTAACIIANREPIAG